MPTQSFLDPTTFTISVTTAPAGTAGGTPPSGTQAEPQTYGIGFGRPTKTVFTSASAVPGWPTSGWVTAAWSMAGLTLSGPGDVPISLGNGTLAALISSGVNGIGPAGYIGACDGTHLIVGLPFAAAWQSGWHRFMLAMPVGVPANPDNTFLWVDGVPQTLLQTNAATVLGTPGYVVVGERGPASSPGWHLYADAAEFYAWNRLLTDQEALDDFGGYAPEVGLVAGWPLNDGSGTTAHNIVSGSPDLVYTPSGATSPPIWLT